MNLETPLSAVAGIGPIIAKKLERLNLYTVEDLITHFPFRYEDFSKSSQIAEAKVGEIITISGEVWSIQNVYTRFRKVLTKATINDGSGTIEVVWFNQPWLTKNIKIGDRLQLSGKIDRSGYKTTLVTPSWEKLSNEITQAPLHTGKLISVYPETFGLTSKWLRAKIASILPKIKPEILDPLPENIKNGLIKLDEAIEGVHFPKDFDQALKAQQRLGFDELFFIQLATQKKRLDWQKKSILKPLNIDREKISSFISSLPFELTQAQVKVVEEIIQSLKQKHPMNRLIQGDVGSGKTVVAAIAVYIAHLNNLRSVLLAPTEILAFQHFNTLSQLLSPYGIEIGIYTGSRKKTNSSKDKEPKTNDYPVIVGTHALLSEKLQLDDIGLIVVDEQQRFGVEQRSILRGKAKSPHFLTMTATPIPRTVALTLYGDLDMSVIDELPKGRKVVRTHFVPNKKRADGYKFIKEQVKMGFQVYIITPFIEESETEKSAKAAKVEFERLKKEIFPDLKLGLLHGKLKSKEKEQVLNDFKEGKVDILVSTSVVEVGVDAPNATVMVIEGAERFGLAQLHQLRGRVGRSDQQSYTFLFAEQENSGVVSRLKNLEKIHDGLKLAELDFKIRGSGEIFGTKQSGNWDLKIASLSDTKLISQTRTAALQVLVESPNLDKYPQIKRKLASLSSDIVMPD